MVWDGVRLSWWLGVQLPGVGVEGVEWGAALRGLLVRKGEVVLVGGGGVWVLVAVAVVAGALMEGEVGFGVRGAWLRWWCLRVSECCLGLVEWGERIGGALLG